MPEQDKPMETQVPEIKPEMDSVDDNLTRTKRRDESREMLADPLEDELEQAYSGPVPQRRMRKRKTNYPWLALAVAVFFFDQLSKGWVSNNLDVRDVIQLTSFLNITLLHNEGAAFSFLAHAGGWQRWFFASIASVVCVVLMIWLMRMPRGNHIMAAALALILGGAAGNLWDRVDFGYVVDFIDVYYGTWHWPAFNVADSAITLGAIMLIFHALFIHTEDED